MSHLQHINAVTHNLHQILDSATNDPLLILINEYEAARAALIASARDDDSKDEPFGTAYAALADSPPAATTMEGAVAAIRLVMHEEKTCGSQEEFTVNVLAAAMAYFDGGAA